MTDKKKLAVILMPYFGQWPVWINVYFETCRWNSKIDFIFFTDCGMPDMSIPSNVIVIPMSFAKFNSRFSDLFPEYNCATYPYKICDFRPAYGAMFADFISDYQFFGWGDIDVIYGNLVNYLSPEILDYDVISFHQNHLSGHLTLIRSSLGPTLPAYFPLWSEKVSMQEYQQLDEPENLNGLKVYFRESFSTPLSPLKPWTDGKFNFPHEWYWRSGILTNDIDGTREFPYLHFMHWKGGSWPRKCGNAQWEKLDCIMHAPFNILRLGFKINEFGFFPLSKSQ